jgi:hypothetical protein
MHYYGSSGPGLSGTISHEVWTNAQLPATWACSLFAALGDADKVYGRNFDWVDSPALLLFTHPTNGYASVSMVDLAYLGFGDKANRLTELPLDQRQALLNAPALPFDGMNERGLVVGMAAVPDGNTRLDPGKETIDSLQVIRKMLDRAGTVDEAVAVLAMYNIDWGGGPALHYLSRIDRDSQRWSSFIGARFISFPLTNPGTWRPTFWSVLSAKAPRGNARATTRSINGSQPRQAASMPRKPCACCKMCRKPTRNGPSCMA